MFQNTSFGDGMQVETSGDECRVEVGRGSSEPAELSGDNCTANRQQAGKKNRRKPGGVQSSNTDPYKIHLIDICTGNWRDGKTLKTSCGPIKILYIGVDWLGLGFSGAPCDLGVLCLLETKLRAMTSDEGESSLVEVGGVLWELKPYGAGTGYSRCKFLLVADGMTLMLSESQNEKALKGSLHFSGEFCQGQDPQELYKRARRLAWDCGIRGTICKVQRLDVCVDWEGMRAEFIPHLCEVGHVVKRAKTWEKMMANQTDCTGANFGKRGQDVYFRVYDKAAELATNEAKQERYLETIGRTEMPEQVCRAEFEMRAEFFRETIRLEDASAVFDSLSRVAGYLMNDWFWISENVVQRNHVGRAIGAEWWEESRLEVMRRMRGFKEAERYPKPQINEERMKAQILGLVASVTGAVHQRSAQTLVHAFQLIAESYSADDEKRLMDRIEVAYTVAEARRLEWIAWMQPSSMDAA